VRVRVRVCVCVCPHKFDFKVKRRWKSPFWNRQACASIYRLIHQPRAHPCMCALELWTNADKIAWPSESPGTSLSVAENTRRNPLSQKSAGCELCTSCAQTIRARARNCISDNDDVKKSIQKYRRPLVLVNGSNLNIVSVCSCLSWFATNKD